MKYLDAKGLSCPEPVIMIRKAMMSKEKSYEMVVDNPTSKENVTRYAEHQGYKCNKYAPYFHQQSCTVGQMVHYTATKAIIGYFLFLFCKEFPY